MSADIDPGFFHHVDDNPMNGLGRLRAGGSGPCARGIGEFVEKRGRHLRTPGVVDACEDDVDVIHSSPDRSRSERASARE